MPLFDHQNGTHLGSSTPAFANKRSSSLIANTLTLKQTWRLGESVC